jgi:hypothetical protein
MFTMSLHELTACIYYKLAIDRGLRGCVPEEEHSAHVDQREYSDIYKNICMDAQNELRNNRNDANNSNSSDVNNLTDVHVVKESDLDDALRYVCENGFCINNLIKFTIKFTHIPKCPSVQVCSFGSECCVSGVCLRVSAPGAESGLGAALPCGHVGH